MDRRSECKIVARRATAAAGAPVDVKGFVPAFTPIVLLAVVVATQAGTVFAADDPEAERKARASEHLKRGAELIDAEDLPGALAEFETAYRLVPSPSIQHNFGIVYQGMGRKVAALEAFERFLTEADRAPPAAREHAQKAAHALRGEVAELQVEADLTGATIFVDGRYVGRTPQEKPIYLEPGPHQLSVERTDLGAIHAERLELSAGKRLTVPTRLARAALAETAPAVKQSPPPVAPSPPRRWQRPAAWATAVGAGLAAGVFGTQMFLRQSHVREFNRLGCGTTLPEMGGEDCQQERRSADSAGTRGLMSGLTAGALGLGAAVLFFTLPEKAGSLAVSLRTSPSRLDLGLQGRF